MHGAIRMQPLLQVLLGALRTWHLDCDSAGMNAGLYQGVAAMRASQRRLEAITSNLANISSTAFKRSVSMNHGVKLGRSGRTTLTTTTAMDWSQGPLLRTQVSTDLALMGDGFFAVEGSPEEGELYTRDGHFSINERGVLVTQMGSQVAWQGARGILDPIGAPIRVDLSGQVFQGQRTIGRLRVVDFADRSQLQIGKTGDFVAPDDVQPRSSTAEVHQGALEGSNVSAVEELVALIQTQRTFEAGANLLTMISQSYERLNR